MKNKNGSIMIIVLLIFSAVSGTVLLVDGRINRQLSLFSQKSVKLSLNCYAESGIIKVKDVLNDSYKNSIFTISSDKKANLEKDLKSFLEKEAPKYLEANFVTNKKIYELDFTTLTTVQGKSSEIKVDMSVSCDKSTFYAYSKAAQNGVEFYGGAKIKMNEDSFQKIVELMNIEIEKAIDSVEPTYDDNGVKIIKAITINLNLADILDGEESFDLYETEYFKTQNKYKDKLE